MHRSLLVGVVVVVVVIAGETHARHVAGHHGKHHQHLHHHYESITVDDQRKERESEDVVIRVPTTSPAPMSTPKPDDFETNFVVDAATGIVYNPYSKHHPGRHVCMSHKNVTQPMKTRQTFCRPTYKKYTQRCAQNQICSGIRVVYETGYRDIVTTKQTKQTHYVCCPGWMQTTNRSHGCNKPICATPCANGGTCSKPDSCTCARGYMGRTCEHDIDECKEEKPCDQICVNTPGSYRCECRNSYILSDDGHSCKRYDNEIGFEAKEMQFEELDERIHKIESILEENNPNAIQNSFKEFDTKIDSLSKDVGSLRRDIVQKAEYKEDLLAIKNKILQLDKKSNKIDELSARYDKIKKCVSPNKI